MDKLVQIKLSEFKLPSDLKDKSKDKSKSFTNQEINQILKRLMEIHSEQL